MRALLIDDDKRRTQPLFEYLTNVKNWQVDWATTASEAIGILRKGYKPFDVIILDIMMPEDEEVSGPETEDGLSTGLILLEKINKIRKEPTKVLLLSARSDLQKWVDNGAADYYLKKPQFSENIVKLLTRTAS